MAKFVRRYVFGGNMKSQSSASVFLGLLAFLMVSSIYYAILTDISYIVVRSVITFLMLGAFVAIERSPVSSAVAAFLTPFSVVLLLTIGAIYFDGDFLLYMYTLVGAMFALSYFKSKGVLAYIIAIAIVQGVFLFGFGGNLLGPNFTRTQQYFGFFAVIIINAMVYSFCKSYEVASRAKETFLSNISHEIRTPITSVLGISQMGMEDPNLDTEEAFARIHSSSKLLLRIISDILDFSKLQEGKMPIVQREYGLAALIDDVTHYRYGDSEHIDLIVDVSPQLPATLVGDIERIEQILVNLLSNAYKYTDRGTVTLSVGLGDGDMIQFSVADTGIGMSDEQLKLIHEVYTRFHEKSRASIGGAGLGMSIVYSLVDLMGGKRAIHSTVGQGTTVTVQIPQTKVGDAVIGVEGVGRLAQLKPAQDTKAKPPLVQDKDHYASKQVLVVDDMEMNLFVAKGLLAGYGIDAHTCESGEEALDLTAAGEVYDLILLDNMMPGMSGVETLAALRKTGCTTPIVVFTADAVVGMKESYIASGFDGFLSKPVLEDDLQDILQTFLGL